jgi:hypothetical protein
MEETHLSAVVISPKHAYIKWANSCNTDGFQYAPEYFKKEHSLVILIPLCDWEDEARMHITGLAKEIFKKMLTSWEADETRWPADLTSKTFWKWFDAQLVGRVMDSVYTK